MKINYIITLFIGGLNQYLYIMTSKSSSPGPEKRNGGDGGAVKFAGAGARWVRGLKTVPGLRPWRFRQTQ